MNNMFALHKFFILFAIIFLVTGVTHAATLSVSPNTGVYTVGKTFVTAVKLNTDGKSVNAADGQLSFNPRELQVVSVTRASSIFNLWTEEPSFSNTSGTISFGGGSPMGYKGTAGNILNVTFKPLGAGTPKVTFKSGSVLAADGLGTNVLTGMSGATYTIAAASESPAPEYIPPANTPKAPVVTSESHPDQEKWYTEKVAKLSWEIPSEVTAIRTLLDADAGTVPTIVYDDLISTKTIDDLDEGVSYFHIQFKNKEGWGKISHYKLAVDTGVPVFTIENADANTPGEVLAFKIEDISPIVEYKIQIDGKDPFVYKDEKNTKQYTPETLAPGHHTIIVEAFDSAGNSTVATYAVTIDALEKPTFIEYPTRINTEVIPAIKGKTIPHAMVAVQVKRASDDMIVYTAEGSGATDPYTIESNDAGEFIFIPDTSFDRGVYLITATAKDSKGRLSEQSDEIRIIVEEPGYIQFGTMIISVLSVVIPLVALVLLMIFGSWYLWHKLSLWRKRVRKETTEAEESLVNEFRTVITNLDVSVAELKTSRKGKLTKAELALIERIEQDLETAQVKIAKEIEDIEKIVK